MNKDYVVKVFLNGGFSNAETAQIVGVSERYVRKIKKEQEKPLLNVANYITAVRNGLTAKQDLADYFGVSRMTINRFERSNDFGDILGCLLTLEKYIRQAKSDLTNALGILEQIAKYDSTATAKYYTLKQLLDTLRNV